MKYMACFILVLGGWCVAQETENDNLDKFFRQVSIAYQQKDKVKAKSLLADLNAMDSASYKADIARLKMFAVLKQYENASIKLISLLESDEFDDYLIRNVDEINQVISAANDKSDGPESLGQIAECLVEHYSVGLPPSEALTKLAYLEQFQVLYGLRDNRSLSTDYEIQRILGRAFATCFKTKAYGDLKYDNSTFISKSEVSKICTMHYENAVKLAYNQYLRSQLANEWFCLAARSDFSADSQLLKKQLSFNDMEIENDTAIARQVSVFTSELQKAMRAGKQSSILSEESQDIIAACLSREFETFAKIGIPGRVFQDLVEDMWFFFDEGLPLYFIKQASRIAELRNTLRWYLWYSIIQPLPNEFEEKVIDYQVEYFANKSLDFNDTTQVLSEYKTVLSRRISMWKELFLRLKDNRFVPYYKEGYGPYLFGISCSDFEKHCMEQAGNLSKKLDAAKKRIVENARYAEVLEQMCFFAVVNIYTSYLIIDRPATKFLPDNVMGRDSGTMNEYYVYTFFLPEK